MFIVCTISAVMYGCTPHYVLHLSTPELAEQVVLFEGGSDETEDDDRTTLLEERQQIAKVAKFFQSKKDEFYVMDLESPRMPRCTVKFRRNNEDTDRFWLDPTHIYMRTPDGKYFACKITERESRQLVSVFRSGQSDTSRE
jgi:hypothetical protein